MKDFPTIARDAVGMLGAGLVVWGVSIMSAPVALIVAGSMLLTVAFALARRA